MSLISTQGRNANRTGDPDSVCGTVPSPIGDLLVICSRDALIAIGLPGDNFGELAAHSRAGTNSIAEWAADELSRYFAGRLTTFTVPYEHGIPGFTGAALDALAATAHGTTITYRALADRAGNGRAVRACGNAMARNPIPIVIPCHRVIPTSGQLGRYRGGTHTKKVLLALETQVHTGR